MIILNPGCQLSSTGRQYKWGYESMGGIDGNHVKNSAFTPSSPVSSLRPFEVDPNQQYYLWGLVRNDGEMFEIADLEGQVNPDNAKQPHALHMAACRGVRLLRPTLIGPRPVHGQYGASFNDCHELELMAANFRDVHVGAQFAGCSNVLVEDTTAIVGDPAGLDQFRGTVSLHEGYNRDFVLRNVSGRVVLGNLTWRTKIQRVTLIDCDLELLTLYGDIEEVQIIGGRVQRNIQVVAVNQDRPREILFGSGAEIWAGVQFATYYSDHKGFRQINDSGWWRDASIEFDRVKARRASEKPFVFASSPGGERTWQVNFAGSLSVNAAA